MYTLKKLMYEKYGEDRFALACEIVSRWVRFETKNQEHDAIWICRMCNAHADSEFDLPQDVAEALRRLFGLKTIEELFV
jgi:Fe2+ or Zn2+ uptake regulation protein